jgi:hypothetical protein
MLPSGVCGGDAPTLVYDPSDSVLDDIGILRGLPIAPRASMFRVRVSEPSRSECAPFPLKAIASAYEIFQLGRVISFSLFGDVLHE